MLSSFIGTMTQKCCALFCGVDDSAGAFRLFHFPSNPILHKEWQIKSGTNADLGGSGGVEGK